MNDSVEHFRSCIVPRCRDIGAIEVDRGHALCERHAGLIWYAIERRDAAGHDQHIVGAEGREYQRAEARAKRAAGKRKPAATGQIYFVSVDGLIKVGWTTKLADRVRAYGPKAELLANYAATRSDEANLHRQLTPARFRGREWYDDCPLVRSFIDDAVAKYGPPRFSTAGWLAPKEIVAAKRQR